MDELLKSAMSFIDSKKTELEEINTKDHAEIKQALKRNYFIFIEDAGLENSLKTFKKYRAAIRSIFGFDIPQQRPRKKVEPIEIERELF